VAAVLEGTTRLRTDGQTPPRRHGRREAQANVTRLIDGYREIGHYLATSTPELTRPGLHELVDLRPSSWRRPTRPHVLHSSPRRTRRPLGSSSPLARDLLPHDRSQYMHIRARGPPVVQERMERCASSPVSTSSRAAHPLEAQRRRAVRDVPALALRRQKRFSLEGAEIADPLPTPSSSGRPLRRARDRVGDAPPRRLNVLANILDKPFGLIFSEFEGTCPSRWPGDGDVNTTSASGRHVHAGGPQRHLSLTPNPSHWRP